MKNPLSAIVVSAMLFAPAALFAQDAVVSTPAPATSVVPHFIKFAGALPGAPGKPETVEVKFALYAAQSGGEALWSETQQVSLDPTGKYSVLLGSSVALPDSAFAQGQARWIGVTLSGEQEAARTVVVATPYSLKASDAETLGGHPASDFTLKNALPAGGTDVTQVDGTSGVVVSGSGTGPTVTLGLSSSYLETLGNKIYPQITGTNVMTGKNTYSAGKLLIGSSPVLSAANVVAGSDIILSTSGDNLTVNVNGPSLLKLANGYYPQLTTNNAFSGTNTFSKAITFAGGQTFPGTATLAGNNTFTGNDTFSKTVTFAAGQTFSGVPTLAGINSFSAQNGFIGISASNLDASAQVFVNGPETGFFSVVGSNSSNTPSGSSNADGGVQGIGLTEGVFGYSFDTNTNDYSYGVLGEVEGTGYSDIAVYGSAAAGGNAIGVLGYTSGSGSGVFASNTSPAGFGLSAVSVETSTVGSLYVGYGAAVRADTGATLQQLSLGALVATADDNYAGVLQNNSSEFVTLYLDNEGTGGITNSVPVITAVGAGGACGISGSGDVTCSGRLKTAVSIPGTSRQVEVYSVQSSENWFEDFGSGKLFNGSAKVAIDPKFGQIVNTGVSYHVFLTPKGDCKGLFVTNEGANGFEVRELGSGGSSIEFDYRIVAKRSGHESERLLDATAEMHQLTDHRDEMAARHATMRPARKFIPPPVNARPAPLSVSRMQPTQLHPATRPSSTEPAPR
jgi:hypothetical protein